MLCKCCAVLDQQRSLSVSDCLFWQRRKLLFNGSDQSAPSWLPSRGQTNPTLAFLSRGCRWTVATVVCCHWPLAQDGPRVEECWKPVELRSTHKHTQIPRCTPSHLRAKKCTLSNDLCASNTRANELVFPDTSTLSVITVIMTFLHTHAGSFGEQHPAGSAGFRD